MFKKRGEGDVPKLSRSGNGREEGEIKKVQMWSF